MQDAGKEGDGEFTDDAPPLRGHAVRGARLALLGWGLSQGLTFIAYIVLARLATPTDFGQFAAAMILVGVGNLLGESGMMAALINRRDRIEEAASTAFFALFAGGFLLTLGALALSPLVGLYYHSSRVGLLAAALSASVLIRMLTIVPDSCSDVCRSLGAWRSTRSGRSASRPSRSRHARMARGRGGSSPAPTHRSWSS